MNARNTIAPTAAQLALCGLRFNVDGPIHYLRLNGKCLGKFKTLKGVQARVHRMFEQAGGHP